MCVLQLCLVKKSFGDFLVSEKLVFQKIESPKAITKNTLCHRNELVELYKLGYFALERETQNNFINVNYNNGSTSNSSGIRAKSIHDITTTGITNSIKKLNDYGSSSKNIAVDNNGNLYDNKRSYKSSPPIKVPLSTATNTASLAESQFFARSSTAPEYKNHHQNFINKAKLEDVSVFYDAYDDLSKAKEHIRDVLRVNEEEHSSSYYTSDIPITGDHSKFYSNLLQKKTEVHPYAHEDYVPTPLQKNTILSYSYKPLYEQKTLVNDLIIIEPTEVKQSQDFTNSLQKDKFIDLLKHSVHEQSSYDETKNRIKLNVSSETKSPVFNIFERLKPLDIIKSDPKYENNDRNYSPSYMTQQNQQLQQSERQSTSDFDTADEYNSVGPFPSMIIERSTVVPESQSLIVPTIVSNQNSMNNSFLDISMDEERLRRSRSPSRETSDVSYNNDLSTSLSRPLKSSVEEMLRQELDNDSSSSTTTVSRSNQIHLPVEKQRAVSEILRKRNSMQKVADYKRSFQKTNTFDEDDNNKNNIFMQQQQKQRTLPISKSDHALSSMGITNNSKNYDDNSTVMKQMHLNKAFSVDAQLETLEKNENDDQRAKLSIERLNKLLSTSNDELNGNSNEHLRLIQNVHQEDDVKEKMSVAAKKNLFETFSKDSCFGLTRSKSFKQQDERTANNQPSVQNTTTITKRYNPLKRSKTEDVVLYEENYEYLVDSSSSSSEQKSHPEQNVNDKQYNDDTSKLSFKDKMTLFNQNKSLRNTLSTSLKNSRSRLTQPVTAEEVQAAATWSNITNNDHDSADSVSSKNLTILPIVQTQSPQITFKTVTSTNKIRSEPLKSKVHSTNKSFSSPSPSPPPPPLLFLSTTKSILKSSLLLNKNFNGHATSVDINNKRQTNCSQSKKKSENSSEKSRLHLHSRVSTHIDSSSSIRAILSPVFKDESSMISPEENENIIPLKQRLQQLKTFTENEWKKRVQSNDANEFTIEGKLRQTGKMPTMPTTSDTETLPKPKRTTIKYNANKNAQRAKTIDVVRLKA
ncbi:unnamed protein product, partial [Didymodactylos carnosus]